MIACVIGNGPSRLNFDLEHIQKSMTTYGCNALYRDFMPNHLIAMDHGMTTEIIDNKVYEQCIVHIQQGYKVDELLRKTKNIMPIKFKPTGYKALDSGNYALKMALMDKHQVVYVIGFDYSNSPTDLPNVYSGTDNYVQKYMYPAATMLDSKWLPRLEAICNEFAEQKIIRVGGKKLPVKAKNYNEISIEQFKEIYE